MSGVASMMALTGAVSGGGGGVTGTLVVLETRTSAHTVSADLTSMVTNTSFLTSNSSNSGWGPFDGADMLKVTPNVDCKIWGYTYGSAQFSNSYTVPQIWLGVLNGSGTTVLQSQNLGSYTFTGGKAAGSVEWFLFSSPYSATANTTIQVGTAFPSNYNNSAAYTKSYYTSASSTPSPFTNNSYSGSSFTFDSPTYSGAAAPFDNSNGTSITAGQGGLILVEI